MLGLMCFLCFVIEVCAAGFEVIIPWKGLQCPIRASIIGWGVHFLS